MPLALMELYDALLSAGADEDKARSAAEAVAAYDQRLLTIDAKLDRLALTVATVETLVSHTRVEMRTLCTVIVGIALGILWHVWH